MAVVGLVPVGGDAVATVGKATKAAERALAKGAGIVVWVMRRGFIPDSMKVDFLRTFAGEHVTTLLDAGISDAALVRMMTRAGRLEVLSRTVELASGVQKAGRSSYVLEKTAENELRRLVNDTSPQEQRWWTVGGRPTARIWDVYERASRVAHEVKHGTARGSGRAMTQLDKDVKMLADGRVDEVVWDFYPGPNGAFGPDEALLDAIERYQRQGYNIHIQLWLP